MSDLAEFLLARIAEDEARAQAAIAPGQLHPWGDRTMPEVHPNQVPGEVRGYLGGTWGEHFARWDPARVLAECEAKREAIEAAWADHLRIEGEWGNCRSRDELSAVNDYPDVLRALALPYADCEGYDESWRP